MSRADLTTQTCSIARSVAQVGDEWSFMILRELFLGTRRFDDFLRFTGMSSHLLSKRLRKLEKQGVIRKEAYCSRPLRHEYRLTEMGRDLWPVIIALKQWGDRWLIEGPTPVRIQHRTCGHIAKPEMNCPHCGEVMTAHDSIAVLSKQFENERASLMRST